MDWKTYALLGSVIVPLLLLASPSKIGFRLGMPCALIGTAVWVAAGRVDPVGLLLFGALALAAWWVMARCRSESTLWRGLSHLALMSVCALALLHLWPGIDNVQWLNKASFGEYGGPIRQYINIDKAWVGVALLWAIGLWRHQPSQPTKSSLAITLGLFGLTTCAAVALGMLSGVLVLDVDASKLTILAQWAVINLVITCLVEETVFRHYLQRDLADHVGQTRAILIIGVLFGLVHFPAGPVMVIGASMMGMAYGLLYARHGLWAATLGHFAFNAIHFLVFAYPYVVA